MDQDPQAASAAPGRTQSLYRKYRPMTFADTDLVGQEHVSRTLRNAVLHGRVAHAYLFCGPRGTGKTSTARLLAKAVNCLDPDPNNRPCNQCEACISINQGRTTDMIEIDAASNRGIEDIRDLREQVKYAPTQLSHKFYIIDEAHRLTRDAFNAFLKTLEEPPPNTTFVLATTDPDELLETVASRCQRFDFHRIPADDMISHVRDVCEREGIEIDDDALTIVVRHATGSMRDALGLVDMLATAAGEHGHGHIDADLTRRMLGLSQDERTLALIEAVAERDLADGLRVINEVVDSGQDMRAFGRQVISALRLLLLCRAGADPAEATEEIKRLAQRFELPQLLRVNRQFSETDFAIRNGGFPQLPLELAFVGSLVEDAASPSALEEQPRPSISEPAPAPSPDAPPAPRPARQEPVAPADEPAQSNSAVASDQPTTPEPASGAANTDRGAEQPSAEPGQQSPSVDRFVSHWDAIRTEVKAADRKIEALLASTDPVNVVDDTLYLVAAYPFHAGKLNEPKIKAVIEESITRSTGARVSVQTVLRENMSSIPSAPPSTNGQNSTNSREQVSEAEGESGQSSEDDGEDDPAKAEADPDFDQAVERLKVMFDAEEIDPDELSDRI